ncbi:hypothetical protein D3C85_1514880 [compost metagenome]
MQAPQAAARRNEAREPARFGPENPALRAGIGQRRADLLGAHGAAKTIQHHAHLDAAPGGGGQAFQHPRAGPVHHEDIGFQMHADFRGIDRRA